MGLAIASFARNLFSPAAAEPIVREPNRRWARGAARPELLRLVVAEVVVETPSTRTFALEGDGLAYRAGQHLTVVAGIGGRTIRRCYSFSSSPAAGTRPAITVKRVEGGALSAWLHDHVSAGTELRAMPAAGEFTVDTDPSRARRVGLVAGGVGITPLVSIAETLLREEPQSTVTLLYGSRRRVEVIFHDRLVALAREFPGRLDLHLTIDEPDAAWDGAVGPVNDGAIARLAGEADEWFVCGPQPMMDASVAALAEAGIAADRIRLERFQYAAKTSVELPSQPAALVFHASGRKVIARAGTTILEAAEQSGIPLPSSCRMGGCGACKVKVDGKVVAAEPNCLGEREKSEGWALACCSYGDGRVVIRDY